MACIFQFVFLTCILINNILCYYNIISTLLRGIPAGTWHFHVPRLAHDLTMCHSESPSQLDLEPQYALLTLVFVGQLWSRPVFTQLSQICWTHNATQCAQRPDKKISGNGRNSKQTQTYIVV